MEGAVCSACVQIFALVVALLSPSAQPLARVVEPVNARGCVTARPSADVPEATDGPERWPSTLPPQAMSMLGKVKGSEIKFSFYRGVGGGLRVVTTDGGVTLTFEGGVGLGGSFSAGTAEDLPKSGASAEGRVSLNARLLPVQPPDFGATLDPNGKLQGYTDVKTGKFRTRFHSEPFYLAGDEGSEKGSDVPVVRRSWSLGSEFKIAFKFTFRSAWKGIVDLLTALVRYLPSARYQQVPLSRPVDSYVLPVNLDQGHALRASGNPPSGEVCRAAASPRAGNLGLLLSRCETRTRNGRSRRTARPGTGAGRKRKRRP
ncbi:hypothetical protein ACFHW2_41605 [Actinomadura sp. LOL_016]|uniref:hypothetical protein n=1 Tax=unclassified Actinomadura TaxID=2626254 RepID=UPI003A80A96B